MGRTLMFLFKVAVGFVLGVCLTVASAQAERLSIKGGSVFYDEKTRLITVSPIQVKFGAFQIQAARGEYRKDTNEIFLEGEVYLERTGEKVLKVRAERLSGNVETKMFKLAGRLYVSQEERVLLAEQASFNDGEGVIVFEGPVTVQEKDEVLKAKQVFYWFDRQEFKALEVEGEMEIKKGE